MGIASQRSEDVLSKAAGLTRPRELLMIGTSYRSADIAFREALVRAYEADHLLDSIVLPEVVVLSTCNRFELYAATSDPDAAAESFVARVQERLGPGGAKDRFYVATGAAAVKHLFRVVAGLDSVVVGEPQILSQVRAAGIGSRTEGKAGAILSPLFDRAYRVGSRVRRAYSLEPEEASLSDVAVDAVQRLSPGGQDVMLIGTGKMVRLAARRLRGKASRIYVVTRRSGPPKGFEGAHLVPHSRVRQTASKCGVIISATNSAGPILGKAELRGRRKRVVIDLGMPRNVSPEVRDLPNVRLMDLDDLARAARSRRPPPTVRKAEAAATREAGAFYDWLVQTRLSSTLAELYSWADSVRAEELRRALGRVDLPTERQKRVLEAMGRRIVSKILARPTRFARRKHGTLTEEEKLELLSSVFEVDVVDAR